MMRTQQARLNASLMLTTLAFVIAPINADDASDRKDELVVIVYPIHDLPVYRLGDKGLEFDPSVLLAHIKTKVDENSWKKEGAITPNERTISLVIRQTRANHRRIADVLERHRRHPEEKVERKLNIQTLNYNRIRTGVLNAIFRAERQRAVDVEKAIELIDAQIEEVESTDLSEQQKSPLLESLKNTRKSITRGESPESDAKEQTSVGESQESGSVAQRRIRAHGEIVIDETSPDPQSANRGSRLDSDRSQKRSSLVDPESEQLKQYWDSLGRQLVDVPADVEVLVKRLSVPAPETAWPTWREGELPYLPTTWPRQQFRSR